MSLFLDTRGLPTVGIGICDRCKMKVPLAKMRSDGNSPGLRVCDKPGCCDHFDPWRLPARKPEDITLRFPRPEETLVPEPPINIFQRIVAAEDGVAFGDAAFGLRANAFGDGVDAVVFADSAEALTNSAAVGEDAILLTDEASATGIPFTNVLMLANGAGLTTDSSGYARTLTSSGGIALSNTFPLNGVDTYSTPPSGTLENTDGASIATLVGAKEWCLEFWIRYISASFGIEGNVNNWPFGILSIDPSRLVRYINSALSVNIQTSTGLASGAYSHVALIRDNTTDAAYARYHLAVDGVVRATSANNILKSALEAASGVRLMGFDVNSPTVYFGGLRLIYDTRYYLNNAEGAPVNSFVPDAYPFAA